MPPRSLVEKELIFNVKHSNLHDADKKLLKKIIEFYYTPWSERTCAIADIR